MPTSNQGKITAVQGKNAIIRMFEWWNGAMLVPTLFTPEAFSNYYTDDAKLIVNGNLRGQGLDALARHYRALRVDFSSIQMELPVLDSFEGEGRAFVQCITRAVRDGETSREEAMAAATLAGGKISLLQVIGRKLD